MSEELNLRITPINEVPLSVTEFHSSLIPNILSKIKKLGGKPRMRLEDKTNAPIYNLISNEFFVYSNNTYEEIENNMIEFEKNKSKDVMRSF